MNRWAGMTGAALLLGALGCGETPTQPLVMRPQSLVLFATPKILSDFDHPEYQAGAFLDAYMSLTVHAEETILIFAVGNSDHILRYRGAAYWSDPIDWARYTDGIRVSDRSMNYHQLASIIQAFRAQAAARGVKLKIYDQVDQGVEFAHEHFKLDFHKECFSMEWESFDIRGRLQPDSAIYASQPGGTPEGKLCGEFLVDQTAIYLEELGFDGILYGNQLGTRGRWLPENGPGYSVEEEDAIRHFVDYSRDVLADKELMWFDSYNNRNVERSTWSFPPQGYERFDYLIAAGFCVITFPSRYADNLADKLALPNRPRVLATLDYVDPWYTYNSMTSYPAESAFLERTAIAYRYQVDGLVFFANDQNGNPVPRALIEAFAKEYFAK